jgi:hypothetical protein
VFDASSNIVYQQRLLIGVPNPNGSQPFVAQTIGGFQQVLVDSLVTPALFPAELLAPPNATLRVIITSGVTPTDTIAATIIAADA